MTDAAQRGVGSFFLLSFGDATMTEDSFSPQLAGVPARPDPALAQLGPFLADAQTAAWIAQHLADGLETDRDGGEVIELPQEHFDALIFSVRYVSYRLADLADAYDSARQYGRVL